MANTKPKAATAKEKPSDDANSKAQSNEQSNAGASNDQAQNKPEGNEQDDANSKAEQSVESEPSVNVALLPVKLKGQRLTLAYPFDLQKGANNLIISGKSYAVEDITFNPHTKRQEIELASVTLLDDSELDALTASGWYVQG